MGSWGLRRDQQPSGRTHREDVPSATGGPGLDPTRLPLVDTTVHDSTVSTLHSPVPSSYTGGGDCVCRVQRPREEWSFPFRPGGGSGEMNDSSVGRFVFN